MDCENMCYEADINICDDIDLAAGLTASTTYEVSLSKSLTKEHRVNFTTDTTGKLTILKSAFPSGYFAYGFVRIVLRIPNVKTPTLLTFAGKTYKCVLINLINIVSSQHVNKIS